MLSIQAAWLSSRYSPAAHSWCVDDTGSLRLETQAAKVECSEMRSASRALHAPLNWMCAVVTYTSRFDAGNTTWHEGSSFHQRANLVASLTTSRAVVTRGKGWAL